MVLSILFGKKYLKTKVATVELDVTVREEYAYSARVTTYPVEDGFTLSDHIINDPIRLVLEGIVTDTPIGIFFGTTRSIAAFNQLIEIYRRKELVTVITGLKQYSKMAITSLNVPRDIRTGQSLNFSIELQEVIVDTSVRTEINEQNLFGGVQSKISRDQVSTGENIPLIQADPTNSLKDQATSGVDYGIQGLQTPPTDIAVKIQESTDIIQAVA